jgi:hypothetical protein
MSSVCNKKSRLLEEFAQFDRRDELKQILGNWKEKEMTSNGPSMRMVIRKVESKADICFDKVNVGRLFHIL